MNIKFLLPTIIVFLIINSSSAQNLLSKPGKAYFFGTTNIEKIQSGQSSGLYRSWIANYGSGKAPGLQQFKKIKTDSKGNVIAAGYAGNKTYGTDLLVVKYDKNGNLLWSQIHKGTEPGNNEIADLTIDGNDNICILGKIYNPDTWYDFVTVKYSPDGTELWSKIYDGPLHGSDYPSAITVDGNNNVYVTGWVAGSDYTYDLVTLKYDPQGNLLWNYSYTGGSNVWAYGYGAAVDDSGNVYTAASVYDSTQNYDLLLIKLDGSGKELWSARYDSAGNNEEGLNIALAPGGKIIVGGDAFIGPDYYYLTISFDSNGNILWKNYNPAYFNSLAPKLFSPVSAIDGSGNVYIAGKNVSGDMMVYKINSGGFSGWEDTYTTDSAEGGYSTSITADGKNNIAVGGYLYVKDSAGIYRQKVSVLQYDTAGHLLWNSLLQFGSDYGITTDNSNNTYTASANDNNYLSAAEISDFDTSGNKLWEKNYSGQYGNDDAAKATAADNSGNILIAAESTNKHLSTDYLTLKYDSQGNLLWEKRYESNSDTSYIPESVAVDNSGNVYVTGEKQILIKYQYHSDMLTLAYDANGNLLWSDTHHHGDNCIPVSEKTDDAGNIIILGYRQSNSDFTRHVVLFKYSSSGQLMWEKEVNQNIVVPVGLQIDADGNSYIASQSEVIHTDSSINLDYVLMKFNTSGSLIWSTAFNDSVNSNDYVSSLILGQDNSLYVTGYGRNTIKDITMTVKYDTAGNEIWAAFFDSLGTTNTFQGNRGSAIGEDAAGNIYVTGSYNLGSYDTGIFLLKYDKNGKQLWLSDYNCPDRAQADDNLQQIIVENDGTVYLPGHFYQIYPGYSLETLKYAPDGTLSRVDKYQILTSPAEAFMTPVGFLSLPSENIVEVANDKSTLWKSISLIDYSNTVSEVSAGTNNSGIPSEFKLDQNYPNPFNPVTKIRYSIPDVQTHKYASVRLEVYDILGRKIVTLVNEKKQPGNYEVTFDGSRYASGIYFCRLQAGGFAKVRKMILLK